MANRSQQGRAGAAAARLWGTHVARQGDLGHGDRLLGQTSERSVLSFAERTWRERKQAVPVGRAVDGTVARMRE